MSQSKRIPNILAVAETKIIAPDRELKRATALSSAQWKFIESTTGAQEPDILFNLYDDPRETQNVIEQNPEKAQELRDKLHEFKKRENQVEAPQITVSKQDEDTKNKLRSLGYLGD